MLTTAMILIASMAAPKRAMIDCLKKCIRVFLPRTVSDTHKEINVNGFLYVLRKLFSKYQQNHVLTKEIRGTHKVVF